MTWPVHRTATERSCTLRYLDLVQLYLIRNVEKSYMVRSYYRYLMALALV